MKWRMLFATILFVNPCFGMALEIALLNTRTPETPFAKKITERTPLISPERPTSYKRCLIATAALGTPPIAFITFTNYAAQQLKLSETHTQNAMYGSATVGLVIGMLLMFCTLSSKLCPAR